MIMNKLTINTMIAQAKVKCKSGRVEPSIQCRAHKKSQQKNLSQVIKRKANRTCIKEHNKLIHWKIKEHMLISYKITLNRAHIEKHCHSLPREKRL